MSRLLTALTLCVAIGSAACILGPLDTMGQETIVTEDESSSSEPRLEDDKIEDKKPVYNDKLWFTETFDGCEVSLNRSGSVAKLDVVPMSEQEQSSLGKLFRTRKEAIAAAGQGSVNLLPSMEVVNGAMKPFNDGLYAAVELAVQQGSSGLIESKQAFLGKLAAGLKSAHATASTAAAPHLERAMVYVGAALLLGGATPDITVGALAKAKTAADNYQKQGQLYSRPIGFYTWSKALEGIFTQDRFLQNRDGNSSADQFGLFIALAAIIEGDAALKAQYEQLLSLYAGLTNPYASHTPLTLMSYVDGLASLEQVSAIQKKFIAENPDPFACQGTYFALVPASRSKDMDHFKQTFCTDAPTAKTNMMNLLIEAIRGGKLDLKPDAKSGWYDYQVYALETLLLPQRGPENQHLLLTAAYKKKLLESFKSIITQTRETHVKQLETGADVVSMPPREVDLYPKFPVEPFPTFYLRNARAYRFLGTYLAATLGTKLLAASHGLRADGTRAKQALDAELASMTRLLYGLYILTARAVGLDPNKYLLAEELAEFPADTCTARAGAWIAGWRTDPDILTDPRVIVPMWHNGTNNQMVYWAVLGVKVTKISASYVEGYAPRSRPVGNCVVRETLPRDYLLLMEQMREVRINDQVKPPTRAELRAICNKHGDADAIVKALGELKP